MEEYHNPNPANTPKTSRHRGISYLKPISAAKEAVETIDLADRLVGPGNMRRVGEKWVARCPLPNHQDRSPSFTVYPETNSFFCFGCLRGGDVVELARLAWDFDERDAHAAAAEVLLEFGYEVPERPPAWFRRQERQRPIRDGLHEVRVKAAQRRLFRMMKPLVMDIEDEGEREEEARQMWKDLHPVARLMCAGRDK